MGGSEGGRIEVSGAIGNEDCGRSASERFSKALAVALLCAVSLVSFSSPEDSSMISFRFKLLLGAESEEGFPEGSFQPFAFKRRSCLATPSKSKRPICEVLAAAADVSNESMVLDWIRGLRG